MQRRAVEAVAMTRFVQQQAPHQEVWIAREATTRQLMAFTLCICHDTLSRGAA